MKLKGLAILTKGYIFFSYWKVDFSLECHTAIFCNGHEKKLQKLPVGYKKEKISRPLVREVTVQPLY